jgi:tungstate transport system permease protein
MDLIWQGLRDAVTILAHNRDHVYEIAWRSLVVSGSATAISFVLGVGAGYLVAFRHFRGRFFVMTLVNTGMGVPPVVVGLVVAIFLWRSGPLGDLNWIYSKKAMVIAEVIIATPIITGFTAAAFASLNPKLRLQIHALGASRVQMLWMLLQEVRLPLLAAVMVGFGAAIHEVGASVMVGGNIAGQTRLLPGTIWLNESNGNFGPALALGVILIAMMFAVNALFTWVQLGIHRDATRPQAGGRAAEMPVVRSWLGR